MSTPSEKEKYDHALNLFISYEQKKVLMTLAKEHHRTLAQIVRALLQIGEPILKGFLEAEKQLASRGGEIYAPPQHIPDEKV